MATRRNPFAVRLDQSKKDDLIAMLRHEVESERASRDDIIGEGKDLDYYLHLYEGGDRRIVKNFPWPGAANLTSYLGMEAVDAYRARIVQTIFSDPIWIVEGWADSEPRAPFVEAFHQWKAEEERLQGYLSKGVHLGLIEGTGVLEVFERPQRRRIQRKRTVLAQTDPITSGVVHGPDNRPLPARDRFGDLIDATDPALPSTEVFDNDFQLLRQGPQYRLVSLRDFCFLPGNAQDRADVWGHAKRIYKRVGDLQSAALDGFYDKDAVAEIGEEDERFTFQHEQRSGRQTSTTLPGRFARKELFEISLLHDLDHDGYEEWYLVTIHLRKGVLLRIQRDDLNRSRFIPITPFPRPDSLYGYTLIEKLATIIEEHTSIRNAMADRSTIANAPPVLRVHGSLWNPYLVPWGPLSVMDVRDVNEVQQMKIADVPGSMTERSRETIAAKERVMGLSDSSLGVHPQVDRTLGEVQLVNLQSQVRTDEVIRNVQESMEDLFQIRHQIWERTLADLGPRGEPIPQSVLAGLDAQGIQLQGGRVTADMIRGLFRGKPRGSTDTADLTRLRADFNGFLSAMAQLAGASPMVGTILGMPEILKMIMTQAMRVYRWQDRFTLNAAIAKISMQIQQMQLQGAQPGVPMLPGAGPGASAGGPVIPPAAGSPGAGPGGPPSGPPASARTPPPS